MQEPSVIERLDKFKAALSGLYDQIEQWAGEKNWHTTRADLQIVEPRPGEYQVEKLSVVDENEITVVEVVPSGAWIIGADGRVDLKGEADTEILVYWETGAPLVGLTETGNSADSGRIWRLFRGADEQGWYWIEDKVRSKAHVLTKELFLELVDEVRS